MNAPLSLARNRCLRSRLKTSACRGCVDACPVTALRMGAAGVEVGEGCTGCGRCAAACPVGAVAVEGFERMPDTRGAGALVLDCAHGDSRGANVRLPCLGGLSAAALLTLCAEADRAVVLVDRGACGACDSGGPVHPAAAVVDQVAGWLRSAGVPEPKRPRIVQQLRGERAGLGADPLQSGGRARRGFLAALGRPASPPPAHAANTTPREEILSALVTLAARHGGTMPPDLFHHVAAGADCRGLRVCAATCPTGALLRYRNDERGFNGIAFDTRDCIGCGHCAAVCPNQALRVLPGPGAGAGRRPLTRFVQRECADCGARFPQRADDEATHCERCRKGAQLARAAFTSLFSARTPLQGME